MADYRDALGVPSLLAIRLTAAEDTVRQRLQSRHVGDEPGLAWHVARAVELAGILESAALDEVLIDTTHVDAATVAARVLAAVGWA